MKAIVDAIRNIVSIITTAWDFVAGIIENLISFIKYLGKASAMAGEMILYLPSWVQTFGTICVFVSVLYLIVGRSSGGKKSDD